LKVTRSTRQASKAWVSCSSLTSVLIPVRCAEAAYQVLPISTTDGGRSSAGSGPCATPGGHGGGQTKTSKSQNRVLPTIRSSESLRTTKLDRLARSLPDARDIVEELTARGVRLQLGSSVHDPSDPVGSSHH
jgi:hypothetical protein